MKKNVIGGVVAFSLALMSSQAFADPGLGVRGVGGNLAMVDIQAGSTIGFGGLLDLGYVSENIRLEADIDLWSKSWNAGYDYLYDGNIEWSLSDFAVGGVVKYELGDEEQSARWYVGGGLGMHFLSWDISGGGESDSVSDSRIGVDVLGGVHLKSAEKMSYFAELRYRTVSDWTQTCIRAGVRIALAD